MAYALKTTGIATNLIACLVVDDDGTTIVDLKGNSITPHASIPAVGTATWKGVSRKHIVTGGDGSYTPYGVVWSGTKPTPNVADSDGIGIFIAAAGASAQTGGPQNPFVHIDETSLADPARGLFRDTSGKAKMAFSGSSAGISTTSIPTDGTTKFSMAANWKNDANVQNFYGLESGSLASDSTAANPGNWSSNTYVLNSIGGMPGQGTQPFKPFIVAVFNREMTLSEYQSLHDDWFGTLIQSGGASATVSLSPDPGTAVVGGTRMFAATRNTAAPSGGVTYNVTSSNTSVATIPATSTLAEGATVAYPTATGVSPGTTTITVTNAADSAETDSVVLTVTATKKLKLLVHPDAKSDTGVAGVVFQAPTGGAITGAKIGEFTGKTFEATLESGKAVLKVPVADFGGSALTTSSTPVALVRNSTDTTGIISGTVIEE